MPETIVVGRTSRERATSSRKAETGRGAEAGAEAEGEVKAGAGAGVAAEAQETTSAPIRATATATAIPIDAQSDIEITDPGLLKTQEIGIEGEENGCLEKGIEKGIKIADIAIFLAKRPVNLLPPRTRMTTPTLIHSTTSLARHHLRSRPFVAVGVAILRPCPALTVVLRPTMILQST